MKVSFITKYRDIMALNFYVISRPLFVFGIMIVFFTIGFKPNWRAVIHVAPDESLLFKIVLFTILELIPIVLIYILLALLLLLMNSIKKIKTVYTDETIAIGEEVTITLDNDVIVAETTGTRSEIPWTAFPCMAQTRSFIYLYGTQRRNLIIPKRAFEHSEACEQFWKACQSKVKTMQHRG